MLLRITIAHEGYAPSNHIIDTAKVTPTPPETKLGTHYLAKTKTTITVHLIQGDLPMPETTDQPQTRRQARRARRGAGPGDRIIANFLQKDHPILRDLIQKVAPMLLGFLTSQLPTVLANITNALTQDDDDDAQH